MKNFYVTLHVNELGGWYKKVAFECPTEDVAVDIATDAVSIEGVSHVRIRSCGKPRKCKVFMCTDYEHYNLWYCDSFGE